MPPRRSPRFLSFIVSGAVLGFAVGAFLAVGGVVDEGRSITTAGSYSALTGLGYLGMLGAMIFGLLAAVLAVLLDRRD